MSASRLHPGILVAVFAAILALLVLGPLSADAEPVAFTGRVVDAATGEPVSGARVGAYRPADGDTWVEQWTETDADGLYQLRVPVGTYDLTAIGGAAYRPESERDIAFDGTAPTELDFAVAPEPVAFVGTVRVAGSGEPLPGASIDVESFTGDGWAWVDSVQADGLGRYAIALPAGEYSLAARAPGHARSEPAVRPYDGAEPHDVDFALTRYDVAIEGVVTDAVSGAAVAGAEVWALNPNDETVYDSAVSDESGGYSLRLAPGTYAVTAWSPKHPVLETAGVIYAGTTVELPLALLRHPDAFRGTVTDARTGQPLEGAVVDLASQAEGVTYTERAETGADGTYLLQAPAGTYALTVARDAYTAQSAGGLEFDGETTITTDFALVPTADPPDPEPGDVEYISVEGADRIATAIKGSQLAYPDGLDAVGARTVVIATARNWPDALGGASLAGVLDGPVLLVERDTLAKAVSDEIVRLKADKAVVLGGTAAVSSSVEQALKAQLAGGVTRLAGTDRYRTANAIAADVIRWLGGEYSGAAFVATGGNFPDALAAAPLSAAGRVPLFLVAPGKGVSAETKSAMAAVTGVAILGGPAVVAPDVEQAIREDLGAGASVERLAGANRYLTAAAVAQYGVDELDLEWNRAGIATGQNFPDALTGGVVQGRFRSVMLLTPSQTLDPAVASKLATNKDAIRAVTYFGGSNAVSPAVRSSVARALE